MTSPEQILGVIFTTQRPSAAQFRPDSISTFSQVVEDGIEFEWDEVLFSWLVMFCYGKINRLSLLGTQGRLGDKGKGEPGRP